MNGRASAAWRASVPWLVLGIIAVAVLFWRLQLSFNLDLFFPSTKELQQQILLQQMRSGPGSRFILIGIGGSDREHLSRISEQLRGLLSINPDFLQVQNGLPADEETVVPPVVAKHRFMLADVDYSVDSLRAALQARLQDLAFAGGPQLLDLIAADPYLSLLEIFERLAPVEFSEEPWFTEDGQAVLMAETRAPATDISAQTTAVAAIRNALLSLGPAANLEVDLTGVGAFGVELQRTIRAEATWRSIAATLMLLLVLFFAYRSLRHILLAGLPLGMGVLCGLALVALVFDEVHGITLAFGFTLLGIAIDYPLHLFSHARDETPASAITRIWPTMRIGAFSTLLAYLAIMLAGSRGLAQLGLFTAGGLIVAVASARWWLPWLLLQSPPNSGLIAPSERPQLRLYPALLALVAAISGLAVLSGPMWEDSLTSLSPLPSERLLRDNTLRSALGSADMRYQIMLYDEDLESLLLRNERLEERLAEAVVDGVLGGWRSVSAILPSQQLQRQRLGRIPPDEELQRRLNTALIDLPFGDDAFDPFLEAAAEARSTDLLTPESYSGTPLASLLDTQLFKVDDHWVSLIFLVQPKPQELGKRIRGWEGGPQLTDIRASSDKLLLDFRRSAVRAVGLAALLMLGFLFVARQSPLRIVWLALTVTAALAVTVGLLTVLHGRLNVMHLVGLLLVFGLGLDYALFCSREESRSERGNTRHALMACVASTALAFGILGGSSVPLLKNLGVTVALGSAASFLLSFAGSRLSDNQNQLRRWRRSPRSSAV